ncbi:MAG: hypothetical protein H7A24_15130 [Leptospiraceae bacterium]|nr:hypothetical protein [Leptospiraceae bacterium]
MIKEIIWNTPFEDIRKEADEHFHSGAIPHGLTKSEFLEIKDEFREFLYQRFGKSLKDQKIYATGHQPEIFHPGLLFKDLLLCRLSKAHGAYPIHIVVDTDMYEFIYYYPIKNGSKLELHKFEYHDNSIFSKEDIPKERWDEFKSILNHQKEILNGVLEKDTLERAHYYLDKIINEMNENEKLFIISEKIKDDYLCGLELQINNLKVSELVKLKGFQKFFDNIKERHSDFIEAHNSTLLDYRIEHKIRNHAQPIPDLHENELPFWVLDESSGKRNPAFTDYSGNVLPRAITLTMFLRLFGCDFFIHGKGGARYESVSDATIRKFYKMTPAPYRMATATLHLLRNPNFEFPPMNEKELETKLRDTKYSPEVFLPPDNDLSREKKELQMKFKDPSVNKKDLHNRISELNSKMHSLISEEVNHLENIKSRFQDLQSNQIAFENRTYPFFYYNLMELENHVRAFI